MPNLPYWVLLSLARRESGQLCSRSLRWCLFVLLLSCRQVWLHKWSWLFCKARSNARTHASYACPNCCSHTLYLASNDTTPHSSSSYKTNITTYNSTNPYPYITYFQAYSNTDSCALCTTISHPNLSPNG